MKNFVILRRNGWRTAADLEVAAARSKEVGDQESSGVRWIRSYVLDEGDGVKGTVCIYQATSVEAIRAHASAANLPLDEIIPIDGLVQVRPDPE